MKATLNRDFSIPVPVLRVGLLFLFLASGFAGLIYQSIWSHYLALLLGHAAYAQALVLATFMGGMGLGAALVARTGYRWRNLIRRYAIVELLLGAAGVGFHFLFLPVYNLTLETLLPAVGGGIASDSLKWAIGIGIVLPQSILLGASFPLLSAGLMRRLPAEQGRVLGSLYFTNSMGAALGALCATFVLLPLAGLPGALQVAGLINLLVGIAAWVLASDPEGAGARPLAAAEEACARRGLQGRRHIVLLLLAATFASSAASFVYEVTWIRMLSLAVGTTLHAFELMLAAFIGGLALGSLWIRRRIDHFARPLVAVAWVQLAMGLCALASLAVYAVGAFEWVSALIEILPPTDTGYQLYNLGTAIVAIAIMLPAAFFAGATLPLFTAVLLRAGAGEGIIGRVYAWNTFGAILGVIAAIHVLIPGLGVRNAMISAAGVDIALGCALLAYALGLRAPRAHLVTAVVLALAAVTTALATITFDPYRLASGVFRNGEPRLDAAGEMRYYRDGKTASVSLFDWPDGTRALAYNGKVDASMRFGTERGPSTDVTTNVLASALPLGLHDAPQRAAVIGMGSGLTSHTLLADDRVQVVETIEIEQRIIEAARGFGERVERVHNDPRSRIVVDDARSVLVRGGEPYDVIVSIPSNPWVAGVGMLFADEFYRFIDQRLADDGLFVQWLQLYEIDEALVGSMLTALTPHFEHTRAWMANQSDMLIVARNGDPLGEVDDERLFVGEIGAELARAGIEHPEQLALREIARDGMLPALARALDEPANSYYWPRLTLEAPRTRYRGIEAGMLRDLANRRSLALELLGAGRPLPTAIAPVHEDTFRVERLTRVARQLVALLTEEPEDRPRPDGLSLGLEAELLRLWSGDCSVFNDPQRRDIWNHFHGRIFAALLPLVDSPGLEVVAEDRTWLQCEELPDQVDHALAFTTTAAARDIDALPGRAEAYLQASQMPPMPDNPLIETAYLSAQAALMQRGRYDAAEDLRVAYIGSVTLSEQGELVQGILDKLRDARFAADPPG